LGYELGKYDLNEERREEKQEEKTRLNTSYLAAIATSNRTPLTSAVVMANTALSFALLALQL